MNTILITGGARRIGKGLAIKFSEQGNNIIINYNISEAEANELKTYFEDKKVNCYFIKADVSNSENVNKMFEQIQSDFIMPNILINNAGIFTENTELDKVDDIKWHNTLEINLSSQFYCAREFYNFVISNNIQNARIINMASLGGTEVWKNRTPYNVSKAGVIQLTKSLARDLAPLVSVNCISPGTIEIKDESPSEPLRISNERIPFLRFGNIDDIFDAVNFFATASQFITGNNLIVDGGYSLSR